MHRLWLSPRGVVYFNRRKRLSLTPSWRGRVIHFPAKKRLSKESGVVNYLIFFFYYLAGILKMIKLNIENVGIDRVHA